MAIKYLLNRENVLIIRCVRFKIITSVHIGINGFGYEFRIIK
jgi:hypothetical protein